MLKQPKNNRTIWGSKCGQGNINKFIPTVLFIFMGMGIHAQIDIDSLLGIWNDESLVDTVRLDALDKVVYSLGQSDPDLALDYATQLKNLADEKGHREYVAKAINLSGYIYENNGMLPKAISAYENGLMIFQEIGDKKSAGNILESIGRIHWNSGNYKKSITSRRQSMAIAEELGDKTAIASRLRGISYGYFQQGQFTTALKLLQQSLKISEELEDDYGISWCTNALGVFYLRQGNTQKSLEYYLKGLKINERTGDQVSAEFSLRNIGNAYKKLGATTEALDYLERSLELAQELDDKRGTSLSFSSLGHYYTDIGKMEKVMPHFQQSLQIAKEIGDRRMICSQLDNIGHFYLNQGKFQLSIRECQKSYDIALEIGSLENQQSACECLYKANKELGRNNKALAYHEKIFAIEDSINISTLAENLQQMEFKSQMYTDSIISSKEKERMQITFDLEVSEKEKSRNLFMAGGLLFFLLTIGLFGRNRIVRSAKKRVEFEKDRSDKLLLNILPSEIAEELKQNGKAEARDFQKVSILFTDFKGFTKASEKLSATDIVSEINTCFKAFDDIVDKYKIEKIKTIGDAYMCAGGLPKPTEDSVKNTVLAALEMQDFITKRKAELDAKKIPSFEMRVGIHTGPVVAGIVGVKKFQYDLWGDTVNTASRIESTGQVGMVNISQATFQELKEDQTFVFESRGKIEAKGKGNIEMWFVQLKAKNNN